MNNSYVNNLSKKISNPPSLETKQVFCFWSDLLGFGDIFFANGWNLSEDDKSHIYSRLQNAHSIFLENTMALNEVSLILNDGLVKLHEFKSGANAVEFGRYLRGCIYTHMAIKKQEFKNNLPGPRSILSFGHSIKYLAENIHVDDYVFNYTKPSGQEMSNLALDSGNPIVVYNPSPFQINTAFSKSYILDSLGSKFGVKGSNIYIDDSVLEFSIEFAKKESKELLVEKKDSSIKFVVLNSSDFPLWGFRLEKPIDVNYKGWSTKIYKLLSLFPWDEKHTEFEIEIE